MENNLSPESSIGKNKKKNRNILIAILVIIAVVVCGSIGYYVYRKSNITEITVGLSNIELNDELKANMKDLAGQAQAYFNENKDEMILTSQYGLLYSYKNKTNVLMTDLAKDSGIDKNILKEMDILYIKPEDVNYSKGAELEIFVSVNSSSGYYVVSSAGDEIIFTEEEFKNLLMKYAPAHGDITNPLRGSEEHTAIITAAGLAGEGIDIKHIACDTKYAVVVANEVKNPSNIREVALTNDEGWKVVNSELAVSKSSYIDINSVCPDMDLGLMPIYNIADFGAINTSDMDSIADSLIELNMMTEDDKKTMYAAGCGRFAYIQLYNGKRLIGYINDDRKLEFNEAEDINSTIAYMLQCQENPPVFIAKFE
ncbi:MAG: hypothetical protein Q4D26_05740 [Clostridia bacterium]|nr:hypothetical protein [Clostridia bacterium]